jgi:hypothetical protein
MIELLFLFGIQQSAVELYSELQRNPNPRVTNTISDVSVTIVASGMKYPLYELKTTSPDFG